MFGAFLPPKYLSRRFKTSGKGVGFAPPSHVLVCVARADFSRVEKRRGCRFSRSLVGFLQAHPGALSDVTRFAFGSQRLRDVCELI